MRISKICSSFQRIGSSIVTIEVRYVVVETRKIYLEITTF